MAKARNLMDWFLFMLGVMAIFFVILGIAAFVAWINLVLSGEYTNMMKQIGFVTGRVVSTIALTVFVGMMVFRYFKNRKREAPAMGKPTSALLADDEPEPQESQQPQLTEKVDAFSEDELIRMTELKMNRLSFYDIEDIVKSNPHMQNLRLKSLNWKRFWDRPREGYPERAKGKTKGQIIAEEKATTPLAAKTA